MVRFVSTFTLLATLVASPALASGSTPVPEGSALTLFALGLLGVIIGRRGAMRPRDRKEGKDIK